MINHSDIPQEVQKKIIAFIAALIPEASIYLFGSRARGKHSQWSDIDLALDAKKPLEPTRIDEINSMLKESNIPYSIVVLDFHSASKDMQNSIKQEGIQWK